MIFEIKLKINNSYGKKLQSSFLVKKYKNQYQNYTIPYIKDFNNVFKIMESQLIIEL